MAPRAGETPYDRAERLRIGSAQLMVKVKLVRLTEYLKANPTEADRIDNELVRDGKLEPMKDSFQRSPSPPSRVPAIQDQIELVVPAEPLLDDDGENLLDKYSMHTYKRPSFSTQLIIQCF